MICPKPTSIFRCSKLTFWIVLLLAIPHSQAQQVLDLEQPASTQVTESDSQPKRSLATGKRGMVASVQPIATNAGVNAFRAGGNAIDAAVATALTLGVVDGHNSGIGGGCFVLIRKANGDVVAIDGREMAPAVATRDMFTENGQVVPGRSTTGPLASGVPGALAAYAKALKHGKLQLSKILNEASKVADTGFQVDQVYARNLATSQLSLALFPSSKKMLLKPDGEPYEQGELLKLPDLAQSYRAIAKHGTDWFYRGEFARRTSEWMADNGGIITEADFRNYEAKSREPIRTTYRGYEIVGFPPPSSGGIHCAQILNILENFPMAQLMTSEPGKAHHIIAEAMKLAFADRAHWLGDADFAKVPRGLVDKAYAKDLASLVDVEQRSDVPKHGVPRDWQSNLYGKHTTHIATADAEGNWVAITATVNTSFGSKVVVPGTGIVLNNEMDDFSSRPGVPNAFGLVGAEANAVAPGKRPLSSMTPTIILKDGKPVMTVGAAGGPKIITATLLAIVRHIDGGKSVTDSIAMPRIHHQWRPDKLFVEQTLDVKLVGKLERYGHTIEFLERGGVAQAIVALPDGTLAEQLTHAYRVWRLVGDEFLTKELIPTQRIANHASTPIQMRKAATTTIKSGRLGLDGFVGSRPTSGRSF